MNFDCLDRAEWIVLGRTSPPPPPRPGIYDAVINGRLIYDESGFLLWTTPDGVFAVMSMRPVSEIHAISSRSV